MSINITGFDVRPIFVSKLLNHAGVSPLTGHETMIAKNVNILFEIEEEYAEEINGSLLSFLNKLSPYVSYRDSIYFILDCYDQDMTETGIQTLQVAYDQEKTLQANDLMEIMKETVEMGIYPSLIVSLLGEEKVHEDNPSSFELNNNKSGLNLDAMRNFK